MRDYEQVYPELKCECCGEVTDTVMVYRQRTFYEEIEVNYAALCPPCKEDNDAFWDELWEDYYGGMI
jgi:hypothetical protein